MPVSVVGPKASQRLPPQKLEFEATRNEIAVISSPLPMALNCDEAKSRSRELPTPELGMSPPVLPAVDSKPFGATSVDARAAELTNVAKMATARGVIFMELIPAMDQTSGFKQTLTQR
jgi:hypothetical protein